MAQAETEAYNVKNVQSLRTKQLNVMKEEKEEVMEMEKEKETWRLTAGTYALPRPHKGRGANNLGSPHAQRTHSHTHTQAHTHV